MLLKPFKSVCAIKESIELIASPLTHIVNLSISSGIFPDH
jgi:hypothetical protein